MYYAYPLVDTRIMLKSISVPIDPDSLTVDETENYFVFETDFKVAFPLGLKDGGEQDDEEVGEDADDEEIEGEEMLRPHLYISKDPFPSVKPSNSSSHTLASPDFMLVGSTDIALGKAYFARFVHPRHAHKCVLWGGYINMCKPQITMPGER
jgi:hypothetical protein